MSATAYTSPPHVIALGKMLWDKEDAAELSTLVEASSFPDKPSRDLFKLLATEMPKGASITTLESAIRAKAPHCLPLFNELMLETGTESAYDDASNEHLAERIADDGKRSRLLRSAREIVQGIEEGTPTPDILSRADMQRAALDLAADKRASRFLLRDDAELENLPEAKWLIDGILPADATVAVVGRSGSYKSFLALDWCYHVRTGFAWHDRTTTVSEIVYLCGEGANGIARRSAAWKALNGFTGRLGVHYITNTLVLNEPNEVANLVRAIQSKGVAPGLVVIDTLAKFMVGDENTAKDMGAFVRGADELRRRFGCTVVIIHHTGKDVQKGGRGSNSLLCGVDTEILCERDGKEMEITVSCTKQKDAPEFHPLTLEAVQVANSLALKPSKPYGRKLAGKNLACLLALKEHDDGTGLKYGEWRDRSGEVKGTFDKARTWLRESGYTKVEKGRYSVSEAGRMAILSTRSTSGLLAVPSTSGDLVYSPGLYIQPGVNQTSKPIPAVASKTEAA